MTKGAVFGFKSIPGGFPGMPRLDRKIRRLSPKEITTDFGQSLQVKGCNIACFLRLALTQLIESLKKFFDDGGKSHERWAGINSLASDINPSAFAPNPAVAFDDGDIVPCSCEKCG